MRMSFSLEARTIAFAPAADKAATMRCAKPVPLRTLEIGRAQPTQCRSFVKPDRGQPERQSIETRSGQGCVAAKGRMTPPGGGKQTASEIARPLLGVRLGPTISSPLVNGAASAAVTHSVGGENSARRDLDPAVALLRQQEYLQTPSPDGYRHRLQRNLQTFTES
jgi:hypothetical protein